MLDKIREALESLGYPVCYGSDTTLEGTDAWDYIVFNRSRAAVKNAGGKLDAADRYEVHLVRQDYVPEGEALEVLNLLCGIPGLKAAPNEDIQYNCIFRPDTKAVLEVASMTVLEARKAVP